MLLVLIISLVVIAITLFTISFFTVKEEEYISLTEKGRETLAALLMEEVKKNPNLLNDSDDD